MILTTETSVTLVGKVIYGAIGDKTGSYFSLPEEPCMCSFVPILATVSCS